MKKILFALQFCPLITFAQQDPRPAYTNDTLYTTCGYKIYRGQTLQFGKGTGQKGKFRYISIKNGIPAASIVNNSIIVKELYKVEISPLDFGYVDIIGSVIFKDSSKGTVVLRLAFDKAIENNPDMPTELIVPAQFRNNSRVILHEELNKLFKLFVAGIISKAEYEMKKEQLLGK